jgi:AAA+ ATPase superfamily predicted ATPase
MSSILIGRHREKEELLNLYESGRAEFITIYGRRRVGKTFLINSILEDKLLFKATAILDVNTHRQLNNFAEALRDYNGKDIPILTDWFEAFRYLRIFLEQSKRKRKVLFFDELPWFDTKRSQFISALEHFWNSWASTQSNIMLIVCGSATSWIVKKLFQNRGGLHNRITRRIFLQPFTLNECRLYADNAGLPIDDISLIDSYMIFGGIPYYLDLLNINESLVQNINRLCFTDGGELRDEFNNLYASIFTNANYHVMIVEAIGKIKAGITRDDIKQITKLPESGNLTQALKELELSGFIRKYTPFSRKNKGALYQLVDHSTLFHLAFIKNSSTNNTDFWMRKSETQSFRTWRGYAFEQVCLSHIKQIEKALGISGIMTQVESWRSTLSNSGVQIDLLINRSDRVISICEIKYSDSMFSITKKIAQDIRDKRNIFLEETNTGKSINLTLVTPVGVKRNEYYNIVNSIITAADLITN